MKSKHLIILTGVAAALAGTAIWTSNQETRHSATPGTGGPVLPQLKDKLNEVASLSIQSQTSTLTVSRVDGLWRVPGKWNYAADFNRIREVLNTLADLKILQVIRTTPAERAELQLLTAADPAGTNRTARATEIKLAGAQAQPLALLQVGKTRSRPGQDVNNAQGGYPDSQYVMTGSGAVYLIGDPLQDLTLPLQGWLDPEFITANDVLTIQVTGNPKGDFQAVRSTPNEEFKLQASPPANQEFDAAKVSQAAGLLGYLRFDDIADPALSPEATGLDKPITVQARTQKGTIITLKLGKESSVNATRYATVTVAFAPPAVPASAGTNQQAEAKARTDQNAQSAAAAKALNEKLSPWVYLLNRNASETLTQGLTELLKDKPKPDIKKDADKNPANV